MGSYYPDERDLSNFLQRCGRVIHKQGDGRVLIESLYVDCRSKPFIIEVKSRGGEPVFFSGYIDVWGVDSTETNIRGIIQSIKNFEMDITEIKNGRVYFKSSCRYKKQLNKHLTEVERFLVWCNLVNYLSMKQSNYNKRLDGGSIRR